MSVREFDGVDDLLAVGPGTTLMTGAMTYIMLVYPLSITPPADEAFWCANDSANGVLKGLFIQANNNFDLGSDLTGDSFVTSTFGIAANTWQWLGFSKATGTATPTFHRSVYGSGTWTHTAGNSAIASSAGAVTHHTFGALSPAGGNYRDVRYATVGWWNRSLPNLEVESFSNATLQLYQVSGGAPAALWDFNQSSTATSVSDLMGNGANQTSITQTTVINGADPSGFTFGIGVTGSSSASGPGVAGEFHPQLNYRMWL
jgi:hypothetical protein